MTSHLMNRALYSKYDSRSFLFERNIDTCVCYFVFFVSQTSNVARFDFSCLDCQTDRQTDACVDMFSMFLWPVVFAFVVLVIVRRPSVDWHCISTLRSSQFCQFCRSVCLNNQEKLTLRISNPAKPNSQVSGRWIQNQNADNVDHLRSHFPAFTVVSSSVLRRLRTSATVEKSFAGRRPKRRPACSDSVKTKLSRLPRWIHCWHLTCSWCWWSSASWSSPSVAPFWNGRPLLAATIRTLASRTKMFCIRGPSSSNTNTNTHIHTGTTETESIPIRWPGGGQLKNIDGTSTFGFCFVSFF